MRVEWSLDGFDLNQESVSGAVGAVAHKFHRRWRLAWPAGAFRPGANKKDVVEMLAARQVERQHVGLISVQSVMFYRHRTEVYFA